MLIKKEKKKCEYKRAAKDDMLYICKNKEVVCLCAWPFSVNVDKIN